MAVYSPCSRGSCITVAPILPRKAWDNYNGTWKPRKPRKPWNPLRTNWTLRTLLAGIALFTLLPPVPLLSLAPQLGLWVHYGL